MWEVKSPALKASLFLQTWGVKGACSSLLDAHRGAVGAALLKQSSSCSSAVRLPSGACCVVSLRLSRRQAGTCEVFSGKGSYSSMLHTRWSVILDLCLCCRRRRNCKLGHSMVQTGWSGPSEEKSSRPLSAFAQVPWSFWRRGMSFKWVLNNQTQIWLSEEPPWKTQCCVVTRNHHKCVCGSMGLCTSTRLGILAKHIDILGANITVYSCICVMLSPWKRPLLTRRTPVPAWLFFSSWRLQGEPATG